jgi:hypothetical protein
VRDDARERERGEKNQLERSHRHRHTGHSERERGRIGNWEYLELGFQCQQITYKNTFSGFGSFYSFFVQIKMDSPIHD